MSKHTCKECNNPFESRQYNAAFCGAPCQRAFNNRRLQRGAVLYDLLMIEAYDPEAFKRHGLAERRQELIERFHEEDTAANRKRSWKRANEVMYDTVALLR